jgi:hypothetical protein
VNQKLLRARVRILSLRLSYLRFHGTNQLVLRHLQIEVVPFERLDGDLHVAPIQNAPEIVLNGGSGTAAAQLLRKGSSQKECNLFVGKN